MWYFIHCVCLCVICLFIMPMDAFVTFLPNQTSNRYDSNNNDNYHNTVNTKNMNNSLKRTFVLYSKKNHNHESLPQKNCNLIHMNSNQSNHRDCNKSSLVQFPIMNQDRRELFWNIGMITCVLSLPTSSDAFDLSSPSVSAQTSSASTVSWDDIPVTHKVYFDVRISRSDGTFYVRDDEDPNDKVFRGRLVFGLFGTMAPKCVENFLSYVNVKNNDPLDENPFPSYSRSIFPSLDEASGLVSCGKIPGLEETSFNGAAAIRYRERIISPSLWVEDKTRDATSKNDSNLPHSMKGLLTHRKLDISPSFGITTYSDSRQLDGNYQVFGRVISDDDSKEFFTRLAILPKYTFERPPSGNSEDKNSVISQKVAAEIFEKQKKFFRNAAKAVGDSRIDNIYEGKFLRRVDVTQAGILSE